jgi:hypothetical protein
VDHDLPPVNGKFQRAFQDVGDLLVVVLVPRHMGAFFQEYARQHDLFADHHLAVDQVIQLLVLDLIPGDIFQSGLRAHFFKPPYSRAALSCI